MAPNDQEDNKGRASQWRLGEMSSEISAIRDVLYRHLDDCSRRSDRVWSRLNWLILAVTILTMAVLGTQGLLHLPLP